MMPFQEWWDEVVIRDSGDNLFSRSDLVLTMADQDGGAHVDPDLNEAYANLSRFNSQGWAVRSGGSSYEPGNSLTATSVRQIAHEVEQSLIESFPEKLPPRS